VPQSYYRSQCWHVSVKCLYVTTNTAGACLFAYLNAFGMSVLNQKHHKGSGMYLCNHNACQSICLTTLVPGLFRLAIHGCFQGDEVAIYSVKDMAVYKAEYDGEKFWSSKPKYVLQGKSWTLGATSLPASCMFTVHARGSGSCCMLGAWAL